MFDDLALFVFPGYVVTQPGVLVVSKAEAVTSGVPSVSTAIADDLSSAVMGLVSHFETPGAGGPFIVVQGCKLPLGSMVLRLLGWLLGLVL